MRLANGDQAFRLLEHRLWFRKGRHLGCTLVIARDEQLERLTVDDLPFKFDSDDLPVVSLQKIRVLEGYQFRAGRVLRN